MNHPLPPDAAARPVLYFTLTQIEHAQLPVLVAAGEALMRGMLAQRAAGEMPAGLVAAIDAFEDACSYYETTPGGQPLPARLRDGADPAKARVDLEVEIRATVGVLPRDAIIGRTLAFLAQIDPEGFGARIAGHDLKLDVVPAQMPCPGCTNRRVAVRNCATCRGSRAVPTILRPEDRLHDASQMKVRAGGVPGAPGLRLVLTDAAGNERPS